MAVKNRTASVLARLKNQSREEGIGYQLGLQLFCQEEFLRRLALSKYRENYVLKGGMFLYTLTNFESRPTQDMDFLLWNLHGSLDEIFDIMQEICSIQTGNEFIRLEPLGTEQITPEKKYPGVKTKFMGRIENMRIPFSVDVGIDDVIVPCSMLRKIVTRLPDFDAAEIYTYSVESTIAEKLDAILTRMETTSRMKDFYDIYYLAGIFDFDGETLMKAVRNTLSHRNHAVPQNAFERILAFSQNPFMQTQWVHFKPAQEVRVEFSEVLDKIHVFLESVINEQVQGKAWYCRQGQWH